MNYIDTNISKALLVEKTPHARNFLKNIPLIISGCAYSALNLNTSMKLLSVIAVLLIVFIAPLFLRNVFAFWKTHLSVDVFVFSIIMLLVPAASFCTTMSSYSQIATIVGLLGGISASLFVDIIALIGIVIGFYFCSLLLCVAKVLVEDKENIILDYNIQKEKTQRIQGNLCRISRGCVVIFFLISFLCSFSASIWVDEAFTLRLIDFSYLDVIRLTAADVHPPLYYLMLKFIESIFTAIVPECLFAKIVVAKLFSISAYVLTAFFVLKKIGKSKSKCFNYVLCLCLFATSNLLTYAIEIRMYSWAMFFVTATFLYAKDIMEGNSSYFKWTRLAVFTLCSAYTHNFALVSVASVWLFLLIWVVKNNHKEIRKFLFFGILTVVFYLPWFVVLIKQTSSIADSYWISDITIYSVLGYVEFVFPVLLCAIPAIIFFFFQRKKENSKNLFHLSYGILVCVTTIIIGLIASLVFRPIFVDRYIIPSIMCLWISIMLCWNNMTKVLKSFIAFILFAGCIASELTFACNELELAISADKAMEFVDSIEDKIIIVESDGETNRLARVLATYTENEVCIISTNESAEYELSSLSASIYTNLYVADEKILPNYLEKGETVYYITTDDGFNLSDFNGHADCIYLGKYTFEKEALVYQITPITDSD